MNSYKLLKSQISSAYEIINGADGNMFIPLSMGNTDCRRFLIEWHDGAEVRDADDNLVSYSEDAVRALGMEPPA